MLGAVRRPRDPGRSSGNPTGQWSEDRSPSAPHELAIARKVEAPLESSSGKAPIKVLLALRVSLLSGDNQHIRLGRHRDLTGRPAGQRESQTVKRLRRFS